VPVFLALMLVVGVTMAVIAWHTGNDPVVWGLWGLLVPFLAMLFLPGLLNGTITRIEQ